MAALTFAPRADNVSLILDALKKSENARQQKSGPALAAAPGSATGRRSSPWPWILGAVLLANAVLLGVLLTREAGEPAVGGVVPDPSERTLSQGTDSVPAPRPSSTAPPAAEPESPSPKRETTPSTASPAPPPAQAPVMLSRERRIQSLDTMVGRQIAPPRAGSAADTGSASETRGGTVIYEGEPQPGDRPPPEPGTVVYEGEASPAVGTSRPEAPARSAAPAPESRRSLPTYQDLQLRGELSLAPMHIDIHVYSEDPAERFVFINMRKYTQGNKTTEGPVVESINADGVTLSHQGRRFNLPRD